MPSILQPRVIALAVLLATVSCLLAGATPAQAAVCADYPNQAAAQDAKDTLDADGDGIFCEALPCPCSQKSTKSYVYYGRITQVVDGDTLKVMVRRKVKTVRVIGIDTPESHKPNVEPECGSAEATSAALKWAFDRPLDFDGDGLYDHGREGRKVRLTTDKTQDKTDKYGRLLAYVTRGGSDFGRQQIRKGWADVFVYRHNRFERYQRYMKSLDAASAAGRGVWGLCGGDFHSNQ